MKNPFEHPVNLSNLRKCQRLAYQAALTHFAKRDAERSVLVQLPTGAGKTGLIAVSPFALSGKRVLILTPNLKLARDIADKLDFVQNQAESEYKKLGILDDAALAELELFVLRLEDSANASDIDEHHLIVSNYQQLQDVEKWFAGKADLVDLIIIDEAHHQAASTYQQVLDFFPNARVIGLTATPFRSDGKRLQGKVIYKYAFHEAVRDGVIRNLRVTNVAPEGVQLTFSDQSNKSYTLKQILELKEEAWFNKGIALSQDCCDSIARKAKEKLEELRRAYPGETHQIIAAAMSKRHAREQVQTAFKKLNLRVGLVSSAQEDQATNEETFSKLRQGKLDVIIHIGMLGEGFDHPPLGVAAIFRPFKSLSPYIQFVGRVLRRNGSVALGHVVSHVGLNQLQRFVEFKLFDADDQAFLKKLLEEPGSDVVEHDFVSTPRGEQTDSEAPVITEQGASQLDISSEFVEGVSQPVEDVLGRFQALKGKERDEFLRRLGVDPKSVVVTPQVRSTRTRPVDRRKAERSLLNEREKSIATDVLKTLGLKHTGRDFNKMFQNFAWVVRRVKSMVNDAIGKKSGRRGEVSNQEYEELEKRGVLKKVSTEALAYFRAKRS